MVRRDLNDVLLLIGISNRWTVSNWYLIRIDLCGRILICVAIDDRLFEVLWVSCVVRRPCI